MRYALIGLAMSLAALAPAPATAQVSVSIGINLPAYPTLQRVPGYPVYYAPGIDSNYFFYDGLYWVFEGDNWYASSWYNGPWRLVDPFSVPVYLLRVPVRYYRHRPAYFSGWRADAPPRWGDHWGRAWEERRGGWDRWNRGAAPAPAPLPTYQRRYSGERYPLAQEQARIQTQSYRYQPRESVAQQHFQEQRALAPQARAQPAPRSQPQRAERAPQGRGRERDDKEKGRDR
jgi:hypothetical protein